MSSHPATYYHYEPLLHFDIKQARQGYLAQVGIPSPDRDTGTKPR